jgi:hypothetical protein
MLKTIGELKRSKLYLYDITIDEQYAYYRVDVMLNSKHHSYQRIMGAELYMYELSELVVANLLPLFP